MPLDPAREYIDEVMTRFGELFPGEQPPHVVDRVEKNWHAKAPRIEWEFGTIEHEPSVVVDSIGTEVQELLVTIWGDGASRDESESTARTAKNRLLLACRQVAQRTEVPDPIFFGTFDWLPEANMHLGRKLTGSIAVKFAIPAEQFEEVVITKLQVTEHADYDGNETFDATIHTTADFPADP